MLDLYEELKSIIAALDDRRIDYALCGGLAMAVYGYPRATVDIDLLILPERLDDAKKLAANLGYSIEAMPMTFAKGAVEIRRISKIDPDTGIALPLDLLLVTPEILDIWESRTDVQGELGKLTVVSKTGLIALKSKRSSTQDIADIERLREPDDER